MQVRAKIEERNEDVPGPQETQIFKFGRARHSETFRSETNLLPEHEKIERKLKLQSKEEEKAKVQKEDWGEGVSGEVTFGAIFRPEKKKKLEIQQENKMMGPTEVIQKRVKTSDSLNTVQKMFMQKRLGEKGSL